jgi:hypothetical protein
MMDLLRTAFLPSQRSNISEAIQAVLADPVSSLPLLAELRKTFRAELQTPQRVGVMPFPTSAFKRNEFYTTVSIVRACCALLSVCCDSPEALNTLFSIENFPCHNSESVL